MYDTKFRVAMAKLFQDITGGVTADVVDNKDFVVICQRFCSCDCRNDHTRVRGTIVIGRKEDTKTRCGMWRCVRRDHECGLEAKQSSDVPKGRFVQFTMNASSASIFVSSTLIGKHGCTKSLFACSDGRSPLSRWKSLTTNIGRNRVAFVYVIL